MIGIGISMEMTRGSSGVRPAAAWHGDFQFVAGSEYAQSGEATGFHLDEPGVGDGDVFYAAVGTATQPTTGVIGSPTFHAVAVTGMEADAATAAFAQAVVNTEKWTIPGYSVVNDAPNTLVIPTSEVSGGWWSPQGGPGTVLECINDALGAVNLSDYGQLGDRSDAQPNYWGFTLPAGNVNEVTVYVHGEATASINLNVEVSKDAITWTSVSQIAMTAGAATRSVTFSTLGWNDPGICYVRLGCSGSTFQLFIVYALWIEINP